MTAMPPHRGAAAKPRPYAARSGPPPFPSGLSAPPAACASCSGRRCPPPSHQGQRTSCAVPPRLDITRPVPRQAEQGTGAGGSSSPVEAMRRRAYRRRVLGVRPVPALALLVALLATAATTAGRPVRGAPRCPVFPRDNAWNRRVDRLPVAAGSDRIINAIGADRPVHADFGSGRYDGGPIGIPYTTVSGRQRRVPVRFQYADESDRGPYPIPRSAPIEGGAGSDGDRHVIVVDRGRCRLYELFDAPPVDGGASWRAGSGAIWSLRSNHQRPRGWTSADAAGLPILPGLARYEELRRGGIDHALRFTASRTRKAFVAPARHFASSDSDRSLPPMGLRVRLKASFDTRGFPRQSRVVLAALKRYGMLLADNGSPWFISGAPSSGWDNDDLHALGRVRGSDFEVVDTGR